MTAPNQKRRRKKNKTKEKKKERVKSTKPKQPPEKANRLLTLPPTHYSKVYLLAYAPLRPPDLPPKTHVDSKALASQLPKANVSK
ncbi:uncharacterized protein OCT59_021342 [Rhizophagus irregularis]|uniref:Uncharacterized protein n=1 Tax=Rhizophagus irregularis (strain DAOM 197198w) TaxID=1432141 RepID=A0A015IP25_RHIIW|nr:hypothetical protein RirG_220210 [Rhizophagus irregularis DAOM 197198w]UZO02864.1 hypothetical protein OCT59_021342 [Rhizophagus irregularis]GBC27362.1 hypothetical protein RIR_jg225.t1 [Rhizophagus irregularis DAOM 181602=DAOM 197198]